MAYHKCILEKRIFGEMKKSWIIYLLPLLALGCVTKKIPIQVLKPADVTLPRSAVRVGVMDRTYIAWAAPSPVYQDGQRINRFKDLRRIGPQKTVEGFIVELSGFKRFVTVPVMSPEPVDSQETLVPKAPQAVLDKLAKDSALDVLVCLENYKVDISTDNGIYSTIYYDQFGNEVVVPRFQGRRTITVTVFWRIYDLKKNVIINERILDTELVFSSTGYNPDEIYRNLPEQKGSVENTSQVAGIDYAKTLEPYWKDSERMIYVGQSNAWLDAADSAEVGNWSAAAEKWKILLRKSPFPVIQRQAVFNLFTAYEVMGNFDESEYWAQYGKKKYKDRDFDAAVLFLDKRRIENEQIDEQLNENK